MADTATAPGPTPEAAKPDKPDHVPTEVTRQVVRTMTAWGMPEESIWLSLKISKRTFHRHYKSDVKLGLVTTLNAVNANLYKQSLGNTRGAVRAGIYLAEKLSARLNQHHGGDVDRAKRDILADADVIRPTEPIPAKPVL